MNTDELSIEIKGMSDEASSDVSTLIENFKQLNNQLDDTFSRLSKLTNEFKSLDNTSINKSTPKQSKAPFAEYGSLKSQLESLKLPTDLNSEFYKLTKTVSDSVSVTKTYVTANNQVITVTEKVKGHLNGVKVKMKELNEETKNSKNIWGLFTTGLTGAITKLQLAFAGLKSFYSNIKKYTKSATEYEESLNLFTVTMGSKAEEATKWIEKFSKALYIDDSGLMQYMGSLNSLIKGLGVATDKSYIMSKNLTQLVYDLASFKNINIDESFRKIQSAMSGEIEPLRNVGVALSQNTLQELANELGIEQRVATMNEASKTQLRYIQILRSTTEWQGDMGRTLISPSNALRVLQQQFTLLGRAIGRVFIPFVMKAIPYVMALTQILTDLANKIAAFFGYKIADIDYSSIKDMTVDISDGIEDIGDAATDTAKKLQTMLAPFDELNVVQRENEKAGNAGGVSGLGSGLDLPLPEYDALAGLTDKLSKNVDKAKKELEAFGKIALAVAGILGTMWAINKVNKFWKALKGLVKDSDGSLTLFGNLANVFKKVIDNFKKGKNETGKLSDGLKNVWKQTSNLTKALIGTTGLVVGTTLSYDSIYKLTKGTGDATKNLIEFGGSMVSSAAGGAALASMIAGVNPLLGVFGGVIVNGLSGLISFSKAMEEMEEKELAEKVFGTLHITAEEFTETLKKNNSEFDLYYENLESNISKIDSLKESYKSNEDALDSYTYKVGVLGQTIGNEYETNMKPKLESMFNDARNMVETSSTAMKDSLINNFKNGTDLSIEEQTRLLNNIDTNSEWAKGKIDSAEQRINEIYSNAQKERRGLNSEELNEIKRLLEEIDKLTLKNVTESETKYYNLKRKFKDKRYQLDIDSYEEFKTARDDYLENKLDELDKAYASEMKLAEYNATLEYERTLEQFGDIEKAQAAHDAKLLELQTTAETNRVNGEEQLRADLKKETDGILEDTTNMWKNLYTKSDEESVKQRSLIEKIFNKLDPDKLEGLKTQMAEEGYEDGLILRNKIIQGFGTDKFKLDSDVEVNVKLETGKIDASNYKTQIENEIRKIKIPSITTVETATKSFKLKADGGFLKTGEFFMAREAGPEMVGRIGNKTAVANNDQITTSITNALVTALSGMNLGGGQGTTVVNIGGRTVFEGVGDYVDSENDRYGTNYVNV